MSKYKTKHAGRSLLTFLLVIAIGFGALIIGSFTGKTKLTPGLALDLEGGTQLILTPTTTDGRQVTDNDLNQAINIIRQRVDASGVAEAEISRQGGSNIVVALPGKPSQETLDLVRSSAVLYFRPVIRVYNANAHTIAKAQNQAIKAAATAKPTAKATAKATGTATASPAATPAPSATAAATPKATPTPVTATQLATRYADVNQNGKIDTTPLTATSNDASSDAQISEKMIYDALMLDCKNPKNLKGGAQDPKKAVISCARDGSGAVYILGPAELKGTDLTSATSALEQTSQGSNTNQWIVSLEFNKQGTADFSKISTRLLQYRNNQSAPQKNQFAIVLDGLTVSAPGIESAITGGKAQISGGTNANGSHGFTQAAANSLANQLSFGSLPLNFTVQSEQQISATLGSEQLQKGLIAGLIGFVLIIIYLAWQYRGLASVAVASLLAAAALTYVVIALLSWGIGYRLSLAGVAGLIVSIGITMDSFIIYFERVRDEVRHGLSLRAAVDEGWVHARKTIIVSDTVNLVAAVVLYVLAVGGVQGFAFTLGVTTVVDLAVIIFFTHPLMVACLAIPFFGQGHRLSGLDPEHLGARSRNVYGSGREKIADNLGKSLARAKREAKREQDASEAKEGDN
ncbi:MAG: protein translocase subunit SecD [Actinomyces graevenitzii]|uniref:Protein translocase subunit SecD n=1 Tax=Actinomyces graevenitzii TaxID=55565 RepID=A0A9E7AKU6_9ACTO|nr:MAG: protein translocase subunit SecD [Actinomyces graevenitzii]